MSDPLLLTRLAHAYGDTRVLEGVDLQVRPGEILGLLGPSGSGKTTLLRAVAGLLTPDSGRIEVAGTVVCEDGRERVPCQARGVGLVFQEYALFPSMTVADNVGFGLSSPDPQRVERLLELTGMAGLGDRRPRQLSGGQQQRAALARALAPKPELLLLDEPFANVDADRRHLLGQELRRVVQDEGRAAMLVTHDRGDALSLCDRIALLDGGRLLQIGPSDQVYREPVSPEAAALTGEHWMDGERIVRPEDTRFIAGDGQVRVSAVAFQGASWWLALDTPAGPALALSRERHAVGESGRVQVDRTWAPRALA